MMFGNTTYYTSPFNAAVTTTTGTSYVQWCQTAASTTGTGVYQNTYVRPVRMSAAEMIYELERKGHAVLQKREYVRNRGLPAWDYSKTDPMQASLEIGRFHGYALPEAAGDYLMPDGSTLHVDQYGNYKILDQDSKVTYKANRIREFNPYVSAADLVEAFIREVGRLDGVKQTEVLGLPIEAFINWLILQAAKKDGDSLEGLPSVEKALPPPIPSLPRCKSCGRFLQRAWAAMRVTFCSQEHMKEYESKCRGLVPA